MLRYNTPGNVIRRAVVRLTSEVSERFNCLIAIFSTQATSDSIVAAGVDPLVLGLLAFTVLAFVLDLLRVRIANRDTDHGLQTGLEAQKHWRRLNGPGTGRQSRYRRQIR
jgi:hypothetical protein